MANLDDAIYPFENLSDDLPLVPLAARRALDHAGLHLSLAGWLSLSLEARRGIALAGVATVVNVASVRDFTDSAEPAPRSISPSDDVDPRTPPPSLVSALFPHTEQLPDIWPRLRPLDRFALVHSHKRATDRNDPERLVAVLRALLALPRSAPLSSHLTPGGEVHMVDVGLKPSTARRAVATAEVHMKPETAKRLEAGETPKGEVLAAARIAGIMAAKRTSDLVPLCHGLTLTSVTVDITIDAPRGVVNVVTTVEAHDRTGVEMEAMVAASIACLTLYDMLKGIDRAMVITQVSLAEKSGGRSGHYVRETK